MPETLRVPPATTVAFQKIATEVCNQAKLDYDEWPLQAHELVTHLERSWREGIENGLTTEAAEERALRLFGDISMTAKKLKKPLLRRILADQRYRPERYFIFLAAFVFYAWLAIVDVHFRPVYETGQAPTVESVDQLMLPFNPAFWVNGLGTFFVGLAGIAAVVVVRWKPSFRNNRLNAMFEARKILGLVALIAALALSTVPSYFTYQTVTRFENYFLYIGFCGLHLAAVGFGWLGAACLLSELFNFPALVKRRQAQRRPFGVVS